MATSSIAQRDLQMGRIPCGPVAVCLSSVCRRRVRDTFVILLDRVCEECHPEPVLPVAPDGHTIMEDGAVMSDDHMKKQEAKKKEAKDAKNDPVKKLAEALKGTMSQGFGEGDLQGNSRLLQRSDGKIEKR